MNLNERGAGTYPIDPIELPIDAPIPLGCGCAWQFHPKQRIKSIKFLHADCAVLAHKVAFNESHIEVPVLVSVEEKRGRGRPRNLAGQWHKGKSALNHRRRPG
jgi:hypothetical protein